MRPLTFSDVKRAAAKFGGTVKREQQGRSIVIEVFAPPNKLWSADGIHSLLVERSEFDTSVEYQEAYAALIRRISYGVDDCDDPECEYCNPPNEEDIGSAIDRFASLTVSAGIIKTPPALTKILVSWAQSIYCAKLIESIDDKLNEVRYRNQTANDLEKLAESKDYQLLNDGVGVSGYEDWDQILPKPGETFEVHIGHFSDEQDKKTDLTGTYDTYNEPTLWLTIYAHGFNGLYNARLNINGQNTGLIKEIQKEKLLRLLNTNGDAIRNELIRFNDFRYRYEVFSESYERALKQTRVECFRHMKPGFTNPQYFRLPASSELQEIGYIKPEEGGLFGTKKSEQSFRAEFIFTETKEGKEKASSLSEEGWRGLYTGNIYIARALPDNPYPNGVRDDCRDIATTAEHELRHLIQTRITETKRLDFGQSTRPNDVALRQTINDLSRSLTEEDGSTRKRHQRWKAKRRQVRDEFYAGLPSRSIREKRLDPYGYASSVPIVGPQEQRLEHQQRDIEFYTNLGDRVAEFKENISQVPKRLHKEFLNAFIAHLLTPEEFAVHSRNVLHQEMGMGKRWGIGLAEMQPWTIRALKIGYNYFKFLKETNEPKYRKAVNEFYKEVQELL